MKILSVELSQYRRLALNHINYIKITPESKIQLILGTNGSGKSSLMKELTPMPGIPNQFRKGGFKIVEISHNNSHYVLKSIFGDKNRFHFIKDGKDLLGDGGNSSVYKELVFQEFGITGEIQSLQLGEGKDGKFTAMEVSKRRNWITRFSDADYTYAIGFYKKLKDQLRECTVGIKLQQARLVQEKEKQLQPEDEARIRLDIKNLSELLSGFLEMKTPLTETSDQVVSKIKQLDNVLQNSTEALNRSWNTFQRRQVTYKSMDEIDNARRQVYADIQSTQIKIDQLCEVLNQQQKTIASLRDHEVMSMSDLDVRIKESTESIQRDREQLCYKDIVIDSPKRASVVLDTIRPVLVGIFLEMEDNKDRRYTSQEHANKLAYFRETGDKMKMVQDLLSKGEEKRKEMEYHRDHSDITCPKCEHTWNQGFDDVTYNKVLRDIKTNEETLIELTRRSIETSEYLERAKSWLESFRAYRDVVHGSTELRGFFQHLMETDVLLKDPAAMIKAMEYLYADLENHRNIEMHQERLKEDLELKVLMTRNQQINLMNLIEESEKTSDDVHRLTVLLQKLKAQDAELEAVRNNITIVNSLRTTAKELLVKRDVLSDSLKSLYHRNAVNASIQLIQSELAAKEQVITRANMLHSVVDNIQAQINELTDKAEVLKIAVKELSPAEGIIAKGLTGFINHYIAQVNSFIKKIWLYPLELIPVMPDADEDVDLDYKFKVRVNDEEDPIDDIDDCSSGMKEIIDLAFRIVSMQYLGMSDFPLTLDEFGKALDPAHRRSAMHVITELLTASNFTQIFMISHYEESYGSLANTDITVLDSRNIELAENTAFNRHVVMS